MTKDQWATINELRQGKGWLLRSHHIEAVEKLYREYHQGLAEEERLRKKSITLEKERADVDTANKHVKLYQEQLKELTATLQAKSKQVEDLEEIYKKVITDLEKSDLQVYNLEIEVHNC